MFLESQRATRYDRLVLCVVLLGVAGANAAAAPTRFLVIRYDDYAPVTPYDRGSNDIQIEQRLFNIVARQNARLAVGVIPFPVAGPDAPPHDPANLKPADSWLADPNNPWVRLLRDNVDRGVVEPALHGFEHRRRSAPGYRPSEFRNQAYEWQLAAIILGRDALSAAVARPIHVFVPPWNAWDANTIRALAALDLPWLSPDLQHADLPTDAVRVAPQCTADPVEALGWMGNPDRSPVGAVVILVTHPFDFYGPGGEANFRDLEQVLIFVNNSRDWAVVGFGDLPPQSPSDWTRRFRDAVAWDNSREILADLPGIGRVLAPSPAPFQPDAWYAQHTWRLQLRVAMLLVVTALGGGIFSVWIARRELLSAGAVRIMALAAALALLWLFAGAEGKARHGYTVSGRRWQAVCATSGSLIGFVASVQRTVRRASVARNQVSCKTGERDEHSIGAG